MKRRHKNEKNRYLVLKGICGLGNRLMCIATAIDYCKKTNRILYVDWTDGMLAKEGINAFSLFFEFEGVSYVEKAEDVIGESYYPEYAKYIPLNFRLLDYFDCYHYHDCRKILRKLIDLGSSFVHRFCSEDLFRRYFVWWWHWYAKDKSVRRKLKRPWGDIVTFGGNLPLKRQEDIVVFIDLAPEYPEELINRHIRLKNNINQEIDEFCVQNNMREKTVGVHIRDTDKKSDIDYEELLSYIKKFMKKHECEKVFLATDQNEVKEIFAKEFGSRLVMYNKYIPEIKSGSDIGIHLWAEKCGNTELRTQMFHDSIVDMWLLSKVDYLLYQGNSTFSNISRVLKEGKNCWDWQKIIKEGKDL